jgi:chromosomal replication initiation ATPase DnaA
VAIEDIDRLAGQPAAARALLHVYNLVVERKGHVLLTARAAPAHLDLPLADLRSRLNALPAVAIGPPDDSLIEAVLVKHFADRRLQVAPDVVAYLVPRLERSFDAVRRAAAALDTASLARRRAVTIALVREVLREEPSPN